MTHVNELYFRWVYEHWKASPQILCVVFRYFQDRVFSFLAMKLNGAQTVEISLNQWPNVKIFAAVSGRKNQ